MQQIQNIPDFEALKINNKAYFEDENYYEDIRNIIETAFKDNENEIETVPLTFVRSFINSQSSLYTNHLNRSLKENEAIDDISLQQSLVYLERYVNLHKRGAIYLYTEDGKVKFKALDPTRYFKTDNLIFLAETDTSTLIYVQQGEGLLLLRINLSLESALNGWDLDKSDLTQQYIDMQNVALETVETELTKAPLVEVTQYNSTKAEANPLVKLQNAFIKDVSWGLFTASAKLLTQVTVETDMGTEEAKALFKDFGSVRNIIKLKRGDKFSIFDAGNIQVLLDVFKTYTDIIEIKAVQAGADINAIIPQKTTTESGVAKQIKLDYINKVRKDNIFTYQIAEEQLFNLLKEVFSIDMQYKGVSFLPLVVAETPEEKLKYHEHLYQLGLINKVRLYALTFNLSYEDAEAEMIRYNLTTTAEL